MSNRGNSSNVGSDRIRRGRRLIFHRDAGR